MSAATRTPQQLADEQRTLDEWKRKLTAKGERRKRGESTREEWESRHESPSHGSIPCRQCSGTGRQEMPPAFVQTLRVMSREWQTTSQLLAKLGRVKSTALCNRLVDMMREGLVERRLRDDNKSYDWRIA